MMMVMLRLGLVLGGLGGASASWAQPEAGGWERVTRLAPGVPVQVVHGNLKRLTGELVAASREGITVDSGGGPVTVAKGEVARVSVGGGRRKRRVLMGLALGAAAGAAGMVAAAQVGDMDIRRDLVAGAGAAAGAGVGALVGAAAGGPRTIYRRP